MKKFLTARFIADRVVVSDFLLMELISLELDMSNLEPDAQIKTLQILKLKAGLLILRTVKK
jgi:hypothetical protein